MKESQVLDALSALSEQTRLRIIRLLVEAGPGGVAAGKIGEALGVSSSRLSFHLAALSRAGLIQQERRSRSVIYSLDYGHIGGVMRYLITDCCKNHPAIVGCCLDTGDAP